MRGMMFLARADAAGGLTDPDGGPVP
jgi:hypothetical protein